MVMKRLVCLMSCGIKGHHEIRRFVFMEPVGGIVLILPGDIEIGICVWESICDWHVRHLLPIQVTRTPDGRYSMAVMLTNLVLRPEQAETFVGFGFDLR